MASSEGTKVTTDPETQQNPINENPGIVTSDSLAAESIQEGGSFGANSDARGPMAQPSYSTTTNTADTSNATVLDPAPDAEARQASEEWNERAELNKGIGMGKDAGRGPTWNTPDGGSTAAGSTTAGSTTAGSTTAGSSTGVTDATNTQTTASGGLSDTANARTTASGGELKPKGKDITEGGFDSNAPNASFNTDIGGENDPGRVGLAKVEELNTPFAGGAGPREGQVSNDGKYDVLDDAPA